MTFSINNNSLVGGGQYDNLFHGVNNDKIAMINQLFEEMQIQHEKIKDQEQRFIEQDKKFDQVQKELRELKDAVHGDCLKNGITNGGLGGFVVGAWNAFLQDPSPISVCSGARKGFVRGAFVGLVGSELKYRYKRRDFPFSLAKKDK